eukprot:IDg7992t1
MDAKSWRFIVSTCGSCVAAQFSSVAARRNFAYTKIVRKHDPDLESRIQVGYCQGDKLKYNSASRTA